jgi:hypothetical protein
MKKSLWIAVAAIAVGYGMNAHAVTGAVFSAWSFETLTQGDVIPGSAASLPGLYGTWAADTNNGVAYITNVSPSGPSFPLPAEAHDKSLYFDGSVTNHFVAANLQGRFVTDFLLKPGQLEDLSLLNQVEASAKLAFFFDTNGNFNLLHGLGGGAIVTSKFSSVVYDSNSWVRITIDQNYAALIGSSSPGFSLAINGTNLSHVNGYTWNSSNTEDFTSGGGMWFEMKNQTLGMNALVGMGIGMLDDVVNLEYGGAAASLDVLAKSINSAFGSVSPTDATIEDGTPQTYTLTVTEGVAAFVSGLKVGSVQIWTNTTQTVKTQTWDVTYANVNAFGTNVTALFAAKSSTTAAWLLDSFTIGGDEPNDYDTVAEAEAADYDGDGFNNKAEAIVGTDPKDNTSFLKIEDISVNGLGQIVVSFMGQAAGSSVAYNLFASDEVNGTYSSIATKPKAGGPLSIIVTPATAKKFYKVVVPYTGE